MNEVADIPAFPPRRPDSHKGTYGRVLVVAGSPGMTGAAFLCSKAALRSGAGLVHCAAPRPTIQILATKFTCVMTVALPADAKEAMAVLATHIDRADALAVGPGLGRHPKTARLVRDLLAKAPCSAVVDADAICALGQDPSVLDKRRAPTVLTPHPGEFSALTGRPADEGLAGAFAQGHRCVVVLKGGPPIVTDGEALWRSTVGNPGMSTAGAGDVLTGIVAGLLAQGLGAWEAARLGAYIHGLAGDLAAADVGEVSMLASDILAWVPDAIVRLAGKAPRETRQ